MKLIVIHRSISTLQSSRKILLHAWLPSLLLFFPFYCNFLILLIPLVVDASRSFVFLLVTPFPFSSFSCSLVPPRFPLMGVNGRVCTRAWVRACVPGACSRARARTRSCSLSLSRVAAEAPPAAPECSIRPAPKFSTPRIRGERRRGEGNVGGYPPSLYSLDRETSSTPASTCAIRLEIRGSQWRGQMNTERGKSWPTFVRDYFLYPKWLDLIWNCAPWNSPRITS